MKKKIKSFLSSELTNKEANQEYAKFHIIPIPLEKTVTYGKGTRNGPLAIINASNQLERLSQTTEPIKKGIFTYPPIDCKKNIIKVIKDIENHAAEIIKKDKVPIGIGGEHSLTYGMVNGIKNSLAINNEDIGIIQIDAHADLRKNYLGEKYSHASVMFLLASEKFKIFQIGVRAISKEEMKFRSNLKINFVDAHQLEKNQFIQNIKLPENFPKKVYITFDADGLDPSIMPATGTPVPRGLSYETAFKILSKLTKKREILGFDFVEFSPIKNIPAYDFISANIVYDLMGIIESNN